MYNNFDKLLLEGLAKNIFKKKLVNTILNMLFFGKLSYTQ